MKKLLIFSIVFFIYGCNQDSPNIQQIENMQFFIDNKKNDQIVESRTWAAIYDYK
jgi:hypothetical protein